MIRFYLGCIFFVQVFFSHPTIQSLRDFPPIYSFLYNYAARWQVGFILEVTAWLLSALVAVYCIKKYQLFDRIDKKSNGLDWLRLGCLLYVLVPILYFAFNRVFPQAEAISYTLLILSSSIVAPVTLLIGFLKVMLTYKPLEKT